MTTGAEGNQTSDAPVGGHTEYAQPVFQKIVRQAVASVQGIRLEPLEAGNPLGKFLHRRRGRVEASGAGERVELTVPLQVEHGRRIPELAGEAQRAVAEDVRRLTGYQEVTVNLNVRGLYSTGEGSGR